MPVGMPVRYAPQAPFTFPKDGWTRLVAEFGALRRLGYLC
jgi:hypothetical protein